MIRMGNETDTQGGLNLAERIRRLANGRATLDVAQFQFIGLAEIRARYGERWSEKRDRVNRVARHFISRRIAPDDVLVTGADGFLLVFGTFSGFLADAAAQRIAKELNAYFLGDPDLDDMQVGTQHHAMSIDDFAAAFGAMLTDAREPAAPAPARCHGDIVMGYTPVWDARRGALATHFISPLDRATGLPLDWDQASHRHADMDERKLMASEADMRALFAGGGRALVGVAMHVSSVHGPQGLARMVQAMTRLDARLMRYRVMRVSCIEAGYPRIYLEDVMRGLRPYAQRIALGLSWAEPDIASVLKLHPAAIGFTLPPDALRQPGLRQEIYARVSAAVELARGQGVFVSVEGDLHAEHAHHFMSEGVNYLCSPRLWPVRPVLTAAETWPRARLEAMAPGRAA
jgi:hypothetical protein